MRVGSTSLAPGEFPLSGWFSNSLEVSTTHACQDASGSIVSQPLAAAELQTALVAMWDTVGHAFTLNFEPPDRLLTRHSTLLNTSPLFDLLGLVACLCPLYAEASHMMQTRLALDSTLKQAGCCCLSRLRQVCLGDLCAQKLIMRIEKFWVCRKAVLLRYL